MLHITLCIFCILLTLHQLFYDESKYGIINLDIFIEKQLADSDW
jgi:hypothetical protein